MKDKTKNILGWLAVSLGILVASIWAFWGAIENFHEGWWHRSLLTNLGMMLIQYAMPMIFITGLNLLSLRFPRIGGVIYFLTAATFSVLIFSRRGLNLWAFLSWLPVTAVPIAIGLLFFHGRPRPRRWGYLLSLILPITVFILFSIGPAIRVGKRFDDGYLGSRLVEGKGVKLVWAPRGPGWPEQGVSYDEALRLCYHLSDDGSELLDSAANFWRLPTVAELVASLTRHNRNAGGVFDHTSGQARYEVEPDKESPLWDKHSMVIYWWTSSQGEDGRIYTVCYNGQVVLRDRNRRLGSLGFRAVREPGR